MASLQHALRPAVEMLTRYVAELGLTTSTGPVSIQMSKHIVSVTIVTQSRSPSRYHDQSIMMKRGVISRSALLQWTAVL